MYTTHNKNVLIGLPCYLLLHVCCGEHSLYECVYQIKYSMLPVFVVQNFGDVLYTKMSHDIMHMDSLLEILLIITVFGGILCNLIVP